MTFIDLTGQKIGRLKIIERSDKKKSGKRLWKCLCDCQLDKPEEEWEYVYVSTSDLRKKANVKSCGCYIRECCIERNKANNKRNNYDLTGEYGIGWTTNTNKEFYFDLDDYDLIKDETWIEVRGYILSTRYNIPMHRIIMNVQDVPYNNIMVDHIKGCESKNDNRKCNLRISTPSQNAKNQRLHKNNRSGISGVNWDDRKKKWIARIGVDNKRINLGCFDNFEDAVSARKKAEDKYFGEWSYSNSQAM